MKRIEAWAVVDFENNITAGPGENEKHIRQIARDFPETDERVVKLVPHNPKADAVVMAARKWVAGLEDDGHWAGSRIREINRDHLVDTVAAYERGLKKGKK